MKSIWLTLLAANFLVVPIGIGYAAEATTSKRPAVASATHVGKGTVNSVDEKALKANISHEPITSLNWPAMTMNFQASDPTLLKDLKPGMKVEFEVQKTADGYRLTKITPNIAR